MIFIEARNLPAHVGIIMDGNGRWAQHRSKARGLGHKEGARAVRRIVRTARRLGLTALTLYAFSEQNWARPEEEIEGLMELLLEFLSSEREEILENSIRLRAVGNVDKLPQAVRFALDALARESSKNEGMTLTLALSYGGREEITEAARSLAKDVVAGKLTADEITEEMLHARMPSVSVGDPDLVIRTGGERRISNFLLYGLAYAELFFSPALWPEFDSEDLYDAIASYQSRERRFGRVGKAAEPLSLIEGDGESGEAEAPPESQRILRIAR